MLLEPQRGQRVRGEPSVGCDHYCHVAFLRLSLPQLPLLPKPLPCEKWRAKDGEVAPWFQSLSVSSHSFSRSSSRRDGRRHDIGFGGYEPITIMGSIRTR